MLCIWYLSAYSGSWGVWTFYLIYIIFKGGFSEYPITISHKLWKRQPTEGKYSKTRFFKNTWKHVGYLFQIQCNTMNKLKVHYLRFFFTVITYIILKVKQFWWQTFEKKTYAQDRMTCRTLLSITAVCRYNILLTNPGLIPHALKIYQFSFMIFVEINMQL